MAVFLPGNPQVGTFIVPDGQRYECVAVNEPLTRPDRDKILVSWWKAGCASCGATIEVWARMDGSSHVSRRCSDCAQPGKPVRKELRNGR